MKMMISSVWWRGGFSFSFPIRRERSEQQQRTYSKVESLGLTIAVTHSQQHYWPWTIPWLCCLTLRLTSHDALRYFPPLLYCRSLTLAHSLQSALTCFLLVISQMAAPPCDCFCSVKKGFLVPAVTKCCWLLRFPSHMYLTIWSLCNVL